LRYISLFSGIEAASVAFDRLGWEAVAFSEIEEFPNAVLSERFPDVPNLGDITKVDWSEYEGSVDVVIGGSPCQSFSVAGKREGLRGESRLMWEYVRAVRSIRPTVFIWENVKGALTSEDGEAFGQLLSEMDGCGYGLAWRVLDAQFFNLAQRRERVFLVGVLGERGGARTACEILFEPDCLRWDNPTSKRKREELAADAPSRPQRGDRRAGRGLRTGGATAFLHHLSAKTRSMGEAFEQSPTLTAARVPAVTHKAD
jgi:DNA (cytosine-5)-methyltransferase 1